MQPTESLGMIHRFVPAKPEVPHPITLLLLHGTGGDENDLLPLGAELLPGAALLGVRGNVLEQGMPRFFRRFGEGVFDVNDLKLRTDELATFIEAASKRYHFSTRKLIAVGYSNGANIAASLILMHPHLLAGAVLFRAMVPFMPDLIRDFSNLFIYLSAGQQDPIAGDEQPERLAATFESGGADVTLDWRAAGHQLEASDVRAAKIWLDEKVRSRIAA